MTSEVMSEAAYACLIWLKDVFEASQITPDQRLKLLLSSACCVAINEDQYAEYVRMARHLAGILSSLEAEELYSANPILLALTSRALHRAGMSVSVPVSEYLYHLSQVINAQTTERWQSIAILTALGVHSGDGINEAGAIEAIVSRHGSTRFVELKKHLEIVSAFGTSPCTLNVVQSQLLLASAAFAGRHGHWTTFGDLVRSVAYIGLSQTAEYASLLDVIVSTRQIEGYFGQDEDVDVSIGVTLAAIWAVAESNPRFRLFRDAGRPPDS